MWEAPRPATLSSAAREPLLDRIVQPVVIDARPAVDRTQERQALVGRDGAAPRGNAEQAPRITLRKPTRPKIRGRLPPVGKRTTQAPTGSAGGVAAARMEEGAGSNTGSLSRAGTHQPAPRERPAGPAGWRMGSSYRGCRVAPAEGRIPCSRARRKGRRAWPLASV